MTYDSQRRMAADILKSGESRIRIIQSKEVEEALTREDIKGLIKKGLIYKLQKKGSSKAYSKQRVSQKKRGRRIGHGSRKGSKGARTPKKGQWIIKIRALRAQLYDLRDAGKIEKDKFREIYMMVKGGFFRNKKHLMSYLKEKEIIIKSEKHVKKERRAKKKSVEKPKRVKKSVKKKGAKKE